MSTTVQYTTRNLPVDQIMPAAAALTIARAAHVAALTNADYNVPAAINAKISHWHGHTERYTLQELTDMLLTFVPEYMLMLATGELV